MRLVPEKRTGIDKIRRHTPLYDEDGRPVRDEAELACNAAFPSMPTYFWNDSNGEKYRSAFFSRGPPSGITKTLRW